MRIFSYRNRRRLRGTVIALICLVVLAALLLLLRFTYLERYLVYTQKGAYLSSEAMSAPTPQPPAAQIPVQIVTVPAEEADDYWRTPKQLSGLSLSGQLNGEPDALRSAIEAARSEDEVLAVMFYVKNRVGEFYYSSALGQQAKVDITGMDGLLRSLRNDRSVYRIAVLPAFSDTTFALQNQSEGLPIRGGALWMDGTYGNYWLDPASDVVRSHLLSELVELKEKGFDEVVFDCFYFPDSPNIVYDREQPPYEIVNAAAAFLADAAYELDIAVSFCTSDPNFILPEHATRVVLSEIEGSAAAETAAQYTDDPLRVLFVTDSHDTRFAPYSVLRPIDTIE